MNIVQSLRCPKESKYEQCHKCKYFLSQYIIGFCNQPEILEDAAGAIERLEAENVALHKRLDKKFELISQQGRELNRRDEVIKKQEKDIDAYAQSARAIALHLDRFCDRSLPYAAMIADAVRKADLEFAEKNKEIEWLMDNLQKQDDAALTELQRRQNKITQLKYEIARVTAERDAAKMDIAHNCATCCWDCNDMDDYWVRCRNCSEGSNWALGVARIAKGGIKTDEL